jgi:hypothetical protein
VWASEEIRKFWGKLSSTPPRNEPRFSVISVFGMTKAPVSVLESITVNNYYLLLLLKSVINVIFKPYFGTDMEEYPMTIRDHMRCTKRM